MPSALDYSDVLGIILKFFFRIAPQDQENFWHIYETSTWRRFISRISSIIYKDGKKQPALHDDLTVYKQELEQDFGLDMLDEFLAFFEETPFAEEVVTEIAKLYRTPTNDINLE